MINLNLDRDTQILVQGITGNYGSKHSTNMIEYGTNIVAGVVPNKNQIIKLSNRNIPVFSTVAQAKKHFPKIKWSVLFVPAPFAKKAAIEALENGLNIVIITEGIPVLDTLEIYRIAQKNNLLMIGPNCPGIAIVGQIKLGIIPNNILQHPGEIGIISRSGTLTYEMVDKLNTIGIGQHTIIGVGGDPLVGFDMLQAVSYMNENPEIKKIFIIGEVGGDMENRVAQYIKDNVRKPVFGTIVGKHIPPHKQMGHAGAIISNQAETAQAKLNIFKKSGIQIINIWDDLSYLSKNTLTW